MPLSKQETEWNYYGYNRSGYNYYGSAQIKQNYSQPPSNLVEMRNFRQKPRKKWKLNWKGRIVLLILMGIFLCSVVPFFLRNVTKPVLLGQPYNSKINLKNYNFLYKPTSHYLYNPDFMNKKILIGANKKPMMQSIYTTSELTSLKNILQAKIAEHPRLNASIYVWDTSNGNYVDIQGEKPFSAASIIKIPVLISLFKAIESGKLQKKDTIPLEEYYRSSGSGSLQYKAQGVTLDIDNLAKLMITESDNSSTNMLMSAIGSMTSVNDDIKRWGLKNTHINTWLPDLEGTNYTSTKDLVTMLHNLDNEAFLTFESRADIFDYMGHVKNNRLLAAGIPNDASIAHKTGDIGSMLGDAGIIYSPNGRKYIVAIMVNRPHNDYSAKEFIVDASKTIYNYMTNY